jgi:hypothetical protein
MKAKHANEVMSDIIRRWPTLEERRESRISARNKHMRKICIILDIEYRPMTLTQEQNGKRRSS